MQRRRATYLWCFKTLLTNESPAARCEVLSTHTGRRLSWHILVRVSLCSVGNFW